MPDELFDKREDNVYRGGGSATTKELAYASCEYAADRTVRLISKVRNVKYAVRWYGYIFADVRVEPPERIRGHFISRYWWRFNNKVAVQQQGERAHASQRWKVPK